jgi:hypothetical protein
LIPRASEAMRDPTDERAPVLPKDGNKVLVCVALVEEDRLPNARGQLQLPMKSFPLCWRRREVPEVVQAAFSNRNDLRPAGKRFQLLQQIRRKVRGVMRMHPRRCEETRRIFLRQLDRAAGAGPARSRDDHLNHARSACARQNLTAIGVVAVVCEVYADVDKGRGGRRRACDIFHHSRWPFY